MTEINHRYLRDLDGEMYFPKTHTDAVIGLEELIDEIKNNQTLVSPLKGKNIVMFGDSNTELGNYPELVAQTLGANVVKAGFYGCRMAQHSGNTYMNNQSMQKMVEFIQQKDFSELVQSTEDYFASGGRDYRPQAQRLNAVDWDTVDLITVFFGGNDFGSANPIGSDTDMTGATFKGAINKIIKGIGETIPNARIIFIAPMFRSRIYSVAGENSDDNPNTAGVYFKEYINAITGVTKLNHIPSINLHDLSGINRYNADSFLIDGKHPNDKGYIHIARIISNQLSLLY